MEAFIKNCRNSCTYCGGDIEDNFSSCGLTAAVFLFPIGRNSILDPRLGFIAPFVGIIICCCTKERKCVICDKVIV